ncbi:MAG: hypothetical protein ACP5JF_06175 [Candidatus Methanodesulfokora sp.]
MKSRYSICSLILLLMASTLVILISAQYSDPVTPTRQYYRPLIGGIQIEISLGYCTIGYTARDAGGRVGIITAGHCVGYSYDEPVYQPVYGSSYYIGKPSLINWVVDAAFVPFRNSAPYILHINNFYGTYYPTKWNVYDYVPAEYVKYFTYVCVYKTGRTTGTTSGQIVDCRGWAIYTDVYGAPGDSGAPLYTISPHGDGALLFGHAYGIYYGITYFMSVSGVASAIGVKPVTYP